MTASTTPSTSVKPCMFSCVYRSMGPKHLSMNVAKIRNRVNCEVSRAGARAGCIGGGEAELRRLAQAGVGLRGGAERAREADLAEDDGVAGQGDVLAGRDERGGDGEVGGGLGDAQAAGDVEVDVARGRSRCRSGLRARRASWRGGRCPSRRRCGAACRGRRARPGPGSRPAPGGCPRCRRRRRSRRWRRRARRGRGRRGWRPRRGRRRSSRRRRSRRWGRSGS